MSKQSDEKFSWDSVHDPINIYQPSDTVRQQIIEKANKLIETGNVNQQDQHKSTALHYAVLAGDEVLVDQLIKRKADMDVFDKNYFAPLHYAVYTNNLNLTKCLLDAGANIDLCYNIYSILRKKDRSLPKDTLDIKNPLWIAVCLRLIDIVHLLVQRGAKTHYDATSDNGCIIKYASKLAGKNSNSNNVTSFEILRLLLNLETFCSKYCSYNSFQSIIHYSSLKVLKLLARDGFDWKHNDACKLAINALDNEDRKVFKFVIENSRINLKNPDIGDSILIHCVDQCSIYAMKYFLRSGVHFKGVLRFYLERTIVIIINCTLLFATAARLVLNYGEDINAFSSYPRSLQFFNSHNKDVLCVLLQHIAKLQATHRHVDQTFYDEIDKCEKFKKYYKRCKTELERSKLVHLLSGVTLFNIFVAKDIVPYAKNLKLVEALKNYDVKSEFPIYYEELDRFWDEIGYLTRRKIAMKYLAEIFQWDENAHYLILENIMRFLSEIDIDILLRN